MEVLNMGEEIKVIVFALGSEEYGVEVEKVRTIERMQPITRVPKTLSFIRGVINLRGIVIPIIDLRERFGMPQKEYSENTRIIIVAANDLEVGLIVDSANDVIDVDSDAINDPPEIVGGIKAKYLRGVAKVSESRLLVLLNLSEVLSKSEISQLEKIEE
jgi:purine-binding chemotaxis protein CheW